MLWGRTRPSEFVRKFFQDFSQPNLWPRPHVWIWKMSHKNLSQTLRALFYLTRSSAFILFIPDNILGRTTSNSSKISMATAESKSSNWAQASPQDHVWRLHIILRNSDAGDFIHSHKLEISNWQWITHYYFGVFSNKAICSVNQILTEI